MLVYGGGTYDESWVSVVKIARAYEGVGDV